MANPKLSIIIPCYNSEKTLREAVESCYEQGFNNEEFEIIMVDDSSADGTKELIKKITTEHNNIFYYFNKTNLGGGATRNVAVSNTKGGVIFCLDSDDLLPPNTLSKMYEYLREKKCDGVAFNFSVKFNGTDIEDVHHIDTFPYVGEKIPFESLIDNSGALCPLHVVFMYTRSAFDKAGGYPTSHGFDTQGFSWRFLSAGLSAYTCPDTKYLHRVNFNQSYYLREANNGMVNYNWQKILIEHFHLFSDEAQDFITSFDCSDFTRNIFTELKNKKNILRDGYQNMLGKSYPNDNIKIKETTPINRNSLRGLFMRVKFRLTKLL